MFRVLCAVGVALCLMAVFVLARPLVGPLDFNEPTAPPSRSTMSSGATDPMMQLSGDWTLISIAGAHLEEHISGTLKISGRAYELSVGCNSIMVNAKYSPTGVRFEQATITKKHCSSDLSALETQILDVLPKIDAFSVGPGDVLSFYDKSFNLMLGARPTRAN